MATSPRGNRIDQRLTDAPPGLWPFVPAGYPSLDFTEKLLTALQRVPIRGVELGFPFSDSIADGPVIQEAFTKALSQGLRVNDLFKMVLRVRPAVTYPILGMVSASIVFRWGMDRFIHHSARCGLDGLIVPDLPLEEVTALAQQAARADLRISLLIAPTTPPAREARIAAEAGGFLYYVSVQGTTGERPRLPDDLEERVRQLRSRAGRPVLVGFGLGTPDHVKDVCRFADGAIVGSAIVRRLADSIADGATEAATLADLTNFVAELAV